VPFGLLRAAVGEGDEGQAAEMVVSVGGDAARRVGVAGEVTDVKNSR